MCEDSGAPCRHFSLPGLRDDVLTSDVDVNRHISQRHQCNRVALRMTLGITFMLHTVARDQASVRTRNETKVTEIVA